MIADLQSLIFEPFQALFRRISYHVGHHEERDEDQIRREEKLERMSGWSRDEKDLRRPTKMYIMRSSLILDFASETV